MKKKKSNDCLKTLTGTDSQESQEKRIERLKQEKNTKIKRFLIAGGALALILILFSHYLPDSKQENNSNIENEASISATEEISIVNSSNDSKGLKNEKSNDNKACLEEAQDKLDNIGGYSPMLLRMDLSFYGYTDTAIDYAMSNIEVDWTEQAKQYCRDLFTMQYTYEEAYSELVGYGFTVKQAKEALKEYYR